MRLRAFAKINLDLRVLGKRQDGFHELRTVFQAIDWFDEIEISPADSFSFVTNDGPQDETNLAVRAVRAFESAAQRRANIALSLKKNIPSGAGLGGGSADAAVSFLGLQKFYGQQADSSILAGLGSDVAFFLSGGRARGAGRGECIEPLDDKTGFWLVLVEPGFAIATKAAYSWLTLIDKSNKIEGFCAQSVFGSEPAEEANDFEGPVFARYPQLQMIRDELLRYGAFRAALSGSGSTVFGQFASEEMARKAAFVFSRKYSVKVTRPLSRAEYFSKMVV